MDPQRIELTEQKIRDTRTSIAGKYDEDVAQEALCQAFEKAKQGKVEKPLHYAAKSAYRIAKDERRHDRYILAYHLALSDVGLGWKPERRETDEAPFVEFQKTPIPESHIYWNLADQVEAKELLSEVKRDPGGLRLIRQTLGYDEKISPSQASKVRARLRQRLLEEQASMEGRDQ